MYREPTIPETVQDVEKISESFLSPFTGTEKKILADNFISSKNNPEAVLLFDLNIYDNIRFEAHKGQDKFGGGYCFRILDGDTIKAQMNFEVKEGSILNVFHREVNSQKLGINGSSLLKKIEEYFGLMIERDKDFKIKGYSMESGQIKVVKWALKNGYSFKEKEEEELFASICSGEESREYIIADVGNVKLEDKKLFQRYIFERGVYEEKKEEMEKNPDLAEKYSLRFTLFKSVKKERE